MDKYYIFSCFAIEISIFGHSREGLNSNASIILGAQKAQRAKPVADSRIANKSRMPNAACKNEESFVACFAGRSQTTDNGTFVQSKKTENRVHIRVRFSFSRVAPHFNNSGPYSPDDLMALNSFVSATFNFIYGWTTMANRRSAAQRMHKFLCSFRCPQKYCHEKLTKMFTANYHATVRRVDSATAKRQQPLTEHTK